MDENDSGMKPVGASAQAQELLAGRRPVGGLMQAFSVKGSSLVGADHPTGGPPLGHCLCLCTGQTERDPSRVGARVKQVHLGDALVDWRSFGAEADSRILQQGFARGAL